jgi:hypothetical protein
MNRFALGLVVLLSGCTFLAVEQRAVKLDVEVRAIQTDLNVLSAAFTPEQRTKYARAKATHDDAALQEFYASLDAQQQTTMQALLERTRKVELERRRMVDEVRQDLARRYRLRREMPTLSAFTFSGI